MIYYSPKKVAQALGVSEASLKRWCDRGLIPFTKTAGGHRRIPRDEVLNFIRDRQTDLVNPEILGLPLSLPPNGKNPSGLNELVEFVKQDRFDEVRRLVISQHLAGKPVHQIHDQVLAPLFHEVGNEWEEGSLEVYQERAGCEFCQRLLYELSNMIPHPGFGAPHALGATLSDDPYTLTNLMAETVLRQQGWRALTLGINLTGQTMVQAILNYQPKLVWLSVSTIQDEERFEADASMIWQACDGQDSLLVMGGRALDAAHRRNLNYHCYCDTMADLANFVTALKD